ncbi:polysaccharide deacetylase family protein, partial [Noviherbaspirillum sp.]|uniref:polysaccharide deacetylase family protein n=1 Tax=Noviherbaspirillum sp. TaxID=1926288 RepID=UPI002FE33330
PTPTGDCRAIIDRCFDLTSPQVTKYKDGKQAAASYTFDDGYSSSTRIATIFENRGLRATFYLIAGEVADADWTFWRGLAAKGHEIGNHSMTHRIVMNDPNLTYQVLDTEINASQRLIEQRIGRKPLTFAFPWHQYSDRALALAMQNHFSVRKIDINESSYRFAYFDQEHGRTQAESLQLVNRQLAEAVNLGGWFVGGGHGVDGDGWSPVTSQFLIDHLTYAQTFSSRLWTDTYANVARYRQCRAQARPVITTASSSQATVRLSGNFNPAVCTEPLTIAMPVREALRGQVTARNMAGAAVPVAIVNGMLLFDARPGSDVTLQVTAAAR